MGLSPGRRRPSRIQSVVTSAWLKATVQNDRRGALLVRASRMELRLLQLEKLPAVTAIIPISRADGGASSRKMLDLELLGGTGVYTGENDNNGYILGLHITIVLSTERNARC